MGDDLSEDPKPQRKPSAFYEIFRDVFPQYLAIGMTAEQFWDGDSWLVKAYRKAYKIRFDMDVKARDRDAWNLGNYIRFALVSVGITVNGFAPKGHHLTSYPEQPFTEKYEEEKREENRKKQEENKQVLAMAMFQAFAEKMNKGIQKRLDREKEKATIT